MNRASLGLLSVLVGLLLSIALAIGLNQGGAQAAQPFYEQSAIVIDLGTPGGSESVAYNINNNMRVVGGGTDSNGTWRAVQWFEGTAISLGLDGEKASYAYGINDPQRIVGLVYSDSNRVAYLWDRGEPVSLGGANTIAQDINDRGQVVGVMLTTDPVPLPIAVMWDGNRPVRFLGTLEGGAKSWAWRINDPGQVVGRATNGDGFWRAFLWDDEVMTDIGTLAGPESSAYGINNQGQVVGSADLNDSVSHAFLWDGNVMTDLGTAGEPTEATFLNSAAISINELGTIAGYSEVIVDGGRIENHAVLWHNEEVIDLNEYLGAGSGWQLLTKAYSVNNRGWIVGEGINDGDQRRAFMADLPTVNLVVEYFLPISAAPISR